MRECAKSARALFPPASRPHRLSARKLSCYRVTSAQRRMLKYDVPPLSLRRSFPRCFLLSPRIHAVACADNHRHQRGLETGAHSEHASLALIGPPKKARRLTPTSADFHVHTPRYFQTKVHPSRPRRTARANAEHVPLRSSIVATQGGCSDISKHLLYRNWEPFARARRHKDDG